MGFRSRGGHLVAQEVAQRPPQAARLHSWATIWATTPANGGPNWSPPALSGSQKGSSDHVRPPKTIAGQALLIRRLWVQIPRGALSDPQFLEWSPPPEGTPAAQRRTSAECWPLSPGAWPSSWPARPWPTTGLGRQPGAARRRAAEPGGALLGGWRRLGRGGVHGVAKGWFGVLLGNEIGG